MALDQSALLELLGELKLTDVSDRIRVATETLYQELIDAEAAAFIGAASYERTDSCSRTSRQLKLTQGRHGLNRQHASTHEPHSKALAHAANDREWRVQNPRSIEDSWGGPDLNP
jgi:hypothetical protein